MAGCFSGFPPGDSIISGVYIGVLFWLLDAWLVHVPCFPLFVDQRLGRSQVLQLLHEQETAAANHLASRMFKT